MSYKHQAHCFRNIKGTRYENYADLIQDKVGNDAIIAEANKLYNKVRKIKNVTGGFNQLFVAGKKGTHINDSEHFNHFM